MTTVILLSAGRHPVSGAAVLPRVEAQAIRLAAGLGQAIGLHAGPDAAAVAEALGLGLSRIEHLPLPESADPGPALAARLAVLSPALILAGRRGQGGDETGMVPYAVAEALNRPLIPDLVALAAGPGAGELSLDQSLGRGARRRVFLTGPALATVHPDAPAPPPYAYGQARRGRIETVAGVVPPVTLAAAALAERPYRRRPKIVSGAPSGGTAAERLKAATGDLGAGGGRLLEWPEPDLAAREILAHLRRIGVLAPPASDFR